ncbi:MAG: hypothetical protein WA136_06085 [Rhodoferax sp.]
MKHEGLQKAVSCLRAVIYDPKGLPELEETDPSPLAQAIEKTYNRSSRLLDMGELALKTGKKLYAPPRIASYESVLALINSVETWIYKKHLLKMHHAAQDVFVLLTELAKQPNTS